MSMTWISKNQYRLGLYCKLDTDFALV